MFTGFFWSTKICALTLSLANMFGGVGQFVTKIDIKSEIL